MQLMVRTIDRVSPGYALCTMSDGTQFEIRGDPHYVDRRVAQAHESGYLPPPQEIVANQFVINDPRLAPTQVLHSPPLACRVEDEEPYLPPTINWQTGEIERHGSAVPSQPAVRNSLPMLLFDEPMPHERGAASEENQPAYVAPTLDFSDRLVNTQRSTPAARQQSEPPTIVTNDDAVYLPPVLDFSDRLKRK